MVVTEMSDTSLNTEAPLELTVVDYVIIGCILAVSLSVGIFLAITERRKANSEYYLLGNRKLHVLPVTLSLFVTFMSATSLIGTPAETYTTGSDFTLHSIGMGLSFFVGIFTVIPIMHPLKVTSMYEYFQLRYQSLGLRLLCTVVGMVQKIIFTAVVLLSPALSVQTVTGLPFWVSVVIVGAVGIIYTSIGGLRGVVLVDVFQSVIIMIGIYAILIKATMEIGGIGATWEIAKAGNRIQPVDFNPDPRIRHSIWALGIGGMFSFFAYTFDQSAVQRICSIPTMTGARIVYAVNIFIVNFYWVSICLMGVVAYSYFTTIGCDPFKSGILTNKNQLMPYFVMRLFQDLPGMTGLYVATIFCAALSTVSSVINGLAANTIEDLLRIPFKKYDVSERAKLLTAKLSVCVYGGLCIGLAFLMRDLPGTVIQTAIGLLGALGGPIVGVFFLGALVPWANKIGATTGIVISLALNIWLTTGGVLYGHRATQLPPVPGNSCVVLDPISDNITTTMTMTTSTISGIITTPVSNPVVVPERTVFDISYQHYGLTGWLMSFTIGLVVSIATYKWCKPVLEERLFFPCVRKCYDLNNSYTVTQTEDNNKGIPMGEVTAPDFKNSTT